MSKYLQYSDWTGFELIGVAHDDFGHGWVFFGTSVFLTQF